MNSRSISKPHAFRMSRNEEAELDLDPFRAHSATMRFFHLSDLHIGKTLHGRDLLEDQAYILGAIMEKVREMEPHAILIAGDIYDRAIPPVEAIRLFDSFIGKLRETKQDIEIVAIPGNHDSAGRLSFGAKVMASSGVHIVTELMEEPAVILDDGTTRASIWALPFLTQANVPIRENEKTAADDVDGSHSGPSIRSQQELARTAMEILSTKKDPSVKNLLVAHCFAAGGVAGDSESSYVGSTEQIDTGLLAGFDYVALGHLHAFQSPAPKIWYSGSPLAYSVLDAEKDKGFIIVDIDPTKENALVRFEPLAPLHTIRKLSGFINELLANPLPAEERSDYLEIDLLDDELAIDAIERFRSLYPNIIGVHQRAYEKAFGAAGGQGSDGGGEEAETDRGAAGSKDELEVAKEDFRNFHREMKEVEPSIGMVELFESIAREAIDASE
jgi:exonuclease SbcD